MRKLRAFSLVEMLITLGIMSIVTLIATETLNTVFRVSAISKFKTVTKNEIGFAIELVERVLANSNVVDVYIYNSNPEDPNEEPLRTYDSENGLIVEKEGDPNVREAFYHVELEPGMFGTEIHVRPYNYPIWVCIGFFEDDQDPTKGYLIKRTMEELPNGHESCFNTTNPSLDDSPLLILNSEDVDVNNFRVSYIKSSNINNVFYLDMEMEPTSWVPGDDSPIQRGVFRQAIITTQGLTWY